jgi:hypothetical protein
LDYLTTHTSLSPIRRGFAPGFVNYKKKCTRLAAASDKVYQLLAHDRWLSPGTSTFSTTKAGRHVIAEILLNVGLKHQKSNKSFPLKSVPCEKFYRSAKVHATPRSVSTYNSLTTVYFSTLYTTIPILNAKKPA